MEKIKTEAARRYENDRLGVTLRGGMAQLTAEDDILVSIDSILFHVKRSSKNNILYEKRSRSIRASELIGMK
ncbi:MAG: hypothetical protein AB2421_09945 [Thermotaleaceae bacterium]